MNQTPSAMKDHRETNRHLAQIELEIRRGLIGTREPALFWIQVRVGAHGVDLLGQVETPREHSMALAIAERHACGLPLVDHLRIGSQTTSRVGTAGVGLIP